MGRPGGLLGASGGLLEASRGREFEKSVGIPRLRPFLEPSWGRLGALLGASRAVLGAILGIFSGFFFRISAFLAVRRSKTALWNP